MQSDAGEQSPCNNARLGHKSEQKERTAMYFVSYITEYPIYEPAEGGYYYAGTTVQMCREFSTWKKANRFYQACRREFIEMWEHDKDRVYDNQWGGCGRRVRPKIKHSSKYIGESEWFELTRTKPVERGWKPYC